MSPFLLSADRQTSVLGAPASPPRAYMPFGYHRSLVDNPRQAFGGQVWERSTGGYLLGNGHRAYNPALMRFHSPDRLSPFGRGGLNSYAYCACDPIDFQDPSGQFIAIAGPIRSMLTGLLNLGITVFKFMNDRRNRRFYTSGDPSTAASRSGVLTTGAIETDLPRMDWRSAALAVVGASTAVASVTTSAMRLAGVDSERLMYTDFAFGVGATTTSVVELSAMAASDPAQRYPIINRPTDASRGSSGFNGDYTHESGEWTFETGGRSPRRRGGRGGEVVIEMSDVRNDTALHV